MDSDSKRVPEERIDQIRDEAKAQAESHEKSERGNRRKHSDRPRPYSADTVGYNNQPILKPPVWTWEIPVYFFVGGIAGMAGLLAFAIWVDVLLTDPPITKGDAAPIAMRYQVARTCLWLSVAGALISPGLLISDLGRPLRFLNMLRVFKWRSAMSVGAWTLVVFTGFSIVASIGFELASNFDELCLATRLSLIGTALSGGVLATYTGVLLGATAIPVWNHHRRTLPLHFGLAGMGSAVSLLLLYDNYADPWLADELIQSSLDWLRMLVISVSAADTVLTISLMVASRNPVDRVLWIGKLGWKFRISTMLLGPVAIVLWLLKVNQLAALSFLCGALLNRFCWIAAGRESANDPSAIFASQSVSSSTGV